MSHWELPVLNWWANFNPTCLFDSYQCLNGVHNFNYIHRLLIKPLKISKQLKIGDNMTILRNEIICYPISMLDFIIPPSSDEILVKTFLLWSHTLKPLKIPKQLKIGDNMTILWNEIICYPVSMLDFIISTSSDEILVKHFCYDHILLK